jgi:hypothetical protein
MAVLLIAATVFVACGDDDDDGGSEEERQEIAELVERLASINGEDATQDDIDFYMAHITDSFVQDFGTESVEACAADAATCIGEPLPNPTVDPESVEIDGDTGEAVIQSEIGSFGIELLREDDVWKGDGLFVADDEIADGTEVVDLTMVDFGFQGDLESEAVKSGDFAFHVVNDGLQQHEVVLIALPAEGSIEDLLTDESFEPEPILVKFPYGAGEESDVALPEPLEPGRYGLVCFLPDTDDPEGTPHAFKGMTAELTVE